jgi:hypothetical protein
MEVVEEVVRLLPVFVGEVAGLDVELELETNHVGMLCQNQGPCNEESEDRFDCNSRHPDRTKEE